MTRDPVGRVLIVVLLFNDVFCQFKVPDVTIQALRPKGIRVSIPEASNKQSLFVFQGNVNRNINNNDVGSISGEVTRPTDGRWVFENPNISLSPNDVINYYVYVVSDRKGYLKDKQSFTVKDLVDPSQPVSDKKPDCRPTVTEVRDGKACSGQVIFEDNFDALREDLWYIEQYIPEQPDYPFVSYQRQTVGVTNGNLEITPKLQQDQPGYSNFTIYSGTLDLTRGCTSRSTYSSKCSKTAWGANILPPVVSGRLTSKMSFKYGVVEIRAKLPKGDWLFPDILLEPLLNKYGFMDYASGLMRIAGSKGNSDPTTFGSEEIGNKLLYGGPILDSVCRSFLIKTRKAGIPWSTDFNLYALTWEPNRITLTVNGIEWGRVEAASNLYSLLPGDCPLPRDLLNMGTKMAPFDDFFYVTLGVSAGGISEFPDGMYTSESRMKPWRNKSTKALYNFWQSLETWWPTWTQPLMVDYVRIKAL